MQSIEHHVHQGQ